MKRTAILVCFAIMWSVGCAQDSASRDECTPINDRCDGDVMQNCQLDVELLRQGQHVYVWADVLVCEDEDVLGAYTCMETVHRDGRVEASCELERDVAARSEGEAHESI